MAERNKIDGFVEMTIGDLLKNNGFDFQVQEANRAEALEKLKAETILLVAGLDIGTTMADCRRFMEEQRVETQDIVFLRRFTKLHPEVTVRYSEIQEEEEQGEEEYSGEDAAPDPSHDVAATAGTGEPEPDFPQTVTTGPLPGDED